MLVPPWVASSALMMTTAHLVIVILGQVVTKESFVILNTANRASIGPIGNILIKKMTQEAE
jgi:hypothetical protein